MKTSYLLLTILSISGPIALVNTPARAQSVDESSSLVISEIGPHHRVFQRVTVGTDRDGNTIYLTNAAYTALETGMNVQQNDGSWVEASDEIEITATGGIAQKARHQVIFAGNCNSPVAIDMLAADGKRFQSRIVGLSYFDSATGQSVLFAELKDADGRLMPSKNEVIYFDAFTDVRSDVRYRNSKAGLEQDIILREQPPSPAEYNLNPDTTRMQVLTEFFNPPAPEKRVRMINGVIDEFLDFGDQKMGSGRVYAMGEESTEIPVTKQWANLAGRICLVEEIQFNSVEGQLNNLPPRTASLKSSRDGVRHRVSVNRLLPAVKQAKKPTQPMKLASAPLRGKGLVLDYITASSATNYTFKSDSTHYIAGTVNLSGTNTIFEGGTVIKYSPTNTPKLNITSPITWQGSSYSPVVMTARSDNTVGETISGSSGNPYTNYFANPALYIDGAAAGTSAVLQYLRIAYAQNAIVFNGSTGHVASHAQFVNCANGITATNTVFNLRNALLFNVLTNFNGSSSTGRCEHLTVDTANWLNCSNVLTLALTNSLLVGVTNTGTFTSNSVSTGTSAAFQTVGAASHYLADNTYRNSGTSNINATLLSALKLKTTYPPIVLTNNITVDTILSPQAQRDTDTPDIGYHYDPLDYVASGITLTNATLTLTNGVALGTYGSSSGHGISLLTQGRIISEGSPTNLNNIVRYNLVQEQANTNWSASTVGASVKFGTGSSQEGRFRFTAWSLLVNRGYHFNDMDATSSTAGFQDCQFRGGVFATYVTCSLTNCLWERATSLGYCYGVGFNMYNNLVKGGSWNFFFSFGNDVIRDNTFDGCTVSDNDYPTVNDHNAYINVSALPGSGGSDKTLTNADYQIGPLGKYYYPTSGGQLSSLIDAGSRNATNASLYHYTTTTTLVKETNTTVDIGFHWVATDANGVPIDTDSDGVPDYLEDRNGNGSVDSDETDWQIYNSPNGLAGGSGLQVFTPLK